MKTLGKISFVDAMTLFFFQPVYGQRLLNKLKEKVEEKVEKKVEERAERKLDESIDKQLDKVEESLEQNNTSPSDEAGSERGSDEQRMQRMLKGLGIAGDPVPVENSYNYNNLIQMHIESFDKSGKKENEGEFVTHFNPQTNSMAYEVISGNMGEPGQGKFIIDVKNEAIIILSEDNGEKAGLVYGIGSFFGEESELMQDIQSEATPEEILANPNLSKTGKTKTIAGYKCEEYKYSDEESESLIWVTNDLKLDTRDYFNTLFKTNLYAQGFPWGYMMEVTTTDKQSGEKSFMQVTKVDNNSGKQFSLSDYKITNLGAVKMPKQE
ncbi:MAG: DUF4412 domain-containing protein [Bacteroidales bacterium]|nr:DUF4412 domain-containing protein [Bacteroidales bacterium]